MESVNTRFKKAQVWRHSPEYLKIVGVREHKTKSRRTLLRVCRKRENAVRVLPPAAGEDVRGSRERYAFFPAGTATPGIFTLNAPIMVRLVKNSVFQSSLPKAMLVVAG